MEDVGRLYVGRVYREETARAGGRWHSHIALLHPVVDPIVDDDADATLHAYSVNKVAVAVAVMDKVDRGLLWLDQTLELSGEIIQGGSGIYRLQTVYGDQLTLANILTALLLMSDNTAVRLLGQVAPPTEINEILAAKGFARTRVEPHPEQPHRYWLGWTTPRETHDLLVRLADRSLARPASCDFLLGILRWIHGYHDGVRRTMSSAERSRIATKYAADASVLGASRHEVGIMFDAAGSPALTYSLFADGLGREDNYGATHPGVQAHAVLGRALLDVVDAG